METFIAEFERQVLRELNVINIKLNNLIDDMNLLSTSINSINSKDALKSTKEKTPEVILNKFPLTPTTLADVEAWIEESEENRDVLVNTSF